MNSTVSGTVISSNLVDYLAVTPGQILVRIDGEDSETEIFTAQQNLEEAQKKLEAAQKNLDNCNAVAQLHQDRYVREPGPVGHQRFRHCGNREPFQHRE